MEPNTQHKGNGKGATEMEQMITVKLSVDFIGKWEDVDEWIQDVKRAMEPDERIIMIKGEVHMGGTESTFTLKGEQQ